MSETSRSGEYRPELLSRRGEAIAWGLALLVAAGWGILVFAGYEAPVIVPVAAAFLFSAALSISLGNWVDRRTTIRLHLEGVEYHNGLRNVRLTWDQIQQVQVLPSALGKKVRVLGDSGHFDYRMVREVMLNGQVRGRTGFQDGERILNRILKGTGLREVTPPESEREEARKAGAQYYARK